MVKIEFSSALEAQIKNLQSIISSLETEIAIRKQLPKPELGSIYEPVMGGDFLKHDYNIKENIDLAMNLRIITELEANLEGKKAWLSNLKERRVIEKEETEKSFNAMISEKDSVIKKGEEIKDPHAKARFDYLLAELNLWFNDQGEDRKEASVYYYGCIVETLKLSGIPVMSIAV